MSERARDVLDKAYEFHAADDARRAGVYPYFKPFDYNDGPEAVLDGKRVTMFGSNNYLGLTTHPKVREAAVSAIGRFGTSMTGSRFVNGSMKSSRRIRGKNRLLLWTGVRPGLHDGLSGESRSGLCITRR